MASDALRREMKFSILVPAADYFANGGDEEVLLQGVIDCCWEKNGELTILDFKTDRVTPENMAERAEYYRGQLEAYAMAMERMTGKKVAKKLLYFFSVGSTAEIN
jgi:ATP-dependent helicase/nuclease subunit A